MTSYHPSTRLVRTLLRCPLVSAVVVAIAGLLLPSPALGPAVVHDHDDIGVVEFNVSNAALGDLLMQQARPREALEAYDASLRIWPNRYNSLLGAARAARAAGDSERARQFYGQLLETTAGAETNRAGVRETREFSAG
jgi:tetratricopeptide (TPR) repeat protein